MRKIINPCKCKVYTRSGKETNKDAFAKIEYDGSRLSIAGVVAPLANGDCLGSAGQCVDVIRNGIPTDNWTREMLDKFCDIWDRWHLNDMRPYCSHMKELGWDKQASELVRIEEWSITKEALEERSLTEKRALASLRNGEAFAPTPEEVAYANLPYSIKLYNGESIEKAYGNFYASVYKLKEKDVLGQSMVQQKTRGWISYKDNKIGLLGKPCPICGYKYGTAWKLEDVPQDVIEWLESLPETKIKPAWV